MSSSQATGSPIRAEDVDGNADVLADATFDRKTAKADPYSFPTPPRTARPSPGLVKAMIDRFAGTYQLDLDLIHSLINAESA